MKTLLYATNCTNTTSTALKYAYRLSLALNAKLHVLHVYDLYPIITATVRSRKVLEQNYFKEQFSLLQTYCKTHLQKDFGSLKIHYHLEKGDNISETILNTAANINADLVLVGANNPSGLRGIFTGNIANDLMCYLQCPVLILPDDYPYHGLSTILYTTDFEESDVSAVASLVEFAQPFGAKIKVIHIPRKKEIDFERKMEWFKQIVSNKVSYPELSFSCKRSEDVESGISDYISSAMPEMLVMMERQKESFIERLLHKDMVKTMEDGISIPLLVFNKKSAQPRLSELVAETGSMLFV